jgi:hypothetical protein
VRKVLRFVEKFDTIGKEELSAVNRKVMEHVSRNTGISIWPKTPHFGSGARR